MRKTIGNVLHNYFNAPMVQPAYMSIHVDFATHISSAENQSESSACSNPQICVRMSRNDAVNVEKATQVAKNNTPWR